MNSIFDPNNLRDWVGLILFIILAYCAGFGAGWWFHGEANSAPLDSPEARPTPVYDPPARHDH